MWTCLVPSGAASGMVVLLLLLGHELLQPGLEGCDFSASLRALRADFPIDRVQIHLIGEWREKKCWHEPEKCVREEKARGREGWREEGRE